MLRQIRLIFILFLSCPALVGAELRVASWNVKHLGWDNDKSYEAVAIVAHTFDFLALQEIMNESSLNRLDTALEATSGSEWEYRQSRALGEGQYDEHYAFLWRESRVDFVDGEKVYIDENDHFLREPYSARFRALETGNTFVAATVHIRFGDSVADRTPAIEALRAYWRHLTEAHGNHREKILLMGDFNLPPDHTAWSTLRDIARPLITEGATTLSPTEGQYASLYDNIWVSMASTLPITGHGILDFPAILETSTSERWNHKRVRTHVSDHAPVYVLFAGAELLDGTEVPQISISEKRCIDLNKATLKELTEIVHIGRERAEIIVRQRPWETVQQLTRIDGIGPSRLNDITEQGLICE